MRLALSALGLVVVLAAAPAEARGLRGHAHGPMHRGSLGLAMHGPVGRPVVASRFFAPAPALGASFVGPRRAHGVLGERFVRLPFRRDRFGRRFDGDVSFAWPYRAGEEPYQAYVSEPQANPGPLVIAVGQPTPAPVPVDESRACGPALITIPDGARFRPFAACPPTSPNVVSTTSHPGPKIIRIE